jgi:hypothetical protein
LVVGGAEATLLIVSVSNDQVLAQSPWLMVVVAPAGAVTTDVVFVASQLVQVPADRVHPP